MKFFTIGSLNQFKIEYYITAQEYSTVKYSNHKPLSSIAELLHLDLLTRFDDGGHGSPVPMLFSSDPKAASTRLETNPQAAYDMLHLLVSRLLIREELSLEEAQQYVANPRKGVVERPLAARFKAKTDPASSHSSSKEEKGTA